jgi:hypothetical protein
MTKVLESHWHGVVKFDFSINDPRCPVCNADGKLGKPSTTIPQKRKVNGRFIMVGFSF